MMSLLPGYSDFINLLDCLQSVFCEISVISLWPITLPLKLKGRVLSVRKWERKEQITTNPHKHVQVKEIAKQDTKTKHIHLSHILPVQPPVGLCPFYFTRISFHLEVLVAFGSTEAKNLQKDHLLVA